LLGGWQEWRASSAVEALRERVRIVVSVLRDGEPRPIPSEQVVPGDVVLLSAGSLVPGDGVLLEAKDFFVNQAVLTGDSLPVEKAPGVVPAGVAVTDRGNCVFMGTSVRSGTARALVVRTGRSTLYGGIADRLRLRPPESEFERGVRRYGYFLTQIMLALVLAVFAANVFLARPPVDSLLFAIALAVGMSPELLPAIISVTLATGARDMAKHGVIVKRLSAIENLGSMDVLCTDKTGTLTAGALRLDAAVNALGEPSAEVLRDACVNAALETGLANPLDEAIRARGDADGVALAGFRKLDEVPYDFVRKRLSIAAARPEGNLELVTKGAVATVLEVCGRVHTAAGDVPLDAPRRAAVNELVAGWCAQGYRVLAVAKKGVPLRPAYGRDDERDLVLRGFLLFLDPPKPGARDTLASLDALGVQLKIVTGDSRLVAAHVAQAVGLEPKSMMTGAEIEALRDEALWHAATRANVFAEVDPAQKERIVLALRRSGHVVGFLGDGINDAPALHTADVGISVDQAVDVAKDAADFVLLEQDLAVLCRGVDRGRVTFANTLKYITITTSANFGNMLSMAAASLFMPFLPLLAKQILLNNFLSDVPAMAFASDRVDPELVAAPPRWDIGRVQRMMYGFGSISSVFDVLTFVTLLYAFGASAELFRTGWFVESLLTELGIALVLRTRRPLWSSRPGRALWLLSTAVTAVTVYLPYSPLAAPLGFVPLPAPLLGALLAITAGYLLCSEIAKRALWRAATPAMQGAV
ncbi:MAG TPA: magnesium-translocating P-type ATPase, partial [Gammaproteobacteria bacterium]|nr:magnesium-translocating P-type ATPase [Gammaproteobacteria bacterium]